MIIQISPQLATLKHQLMLAQATITLICLMSMVKLADLYSATTVDENLINKL